jgi:hypothetical protein
MAKADLTAARLRELLHYDETTGLFTWLVSRSIAVKAGAIAGKPPKDAGYCYVFVDGYLYAAHRLAWLYMTGQWPVGLIDHKDGIRCNNAFSNLRDVTHRQNSENKRKARVDSKTGLMGVTYHAKNRKFQARIQTEGRSRSLGYYPTAEEAHAAYLTEKRLLHSANTL